jgi:hypothetical protein
MGSKFQWMHLLPIRLAVLTYSLESPLPQSWGDLACHNGSRRMRSMFSSLELWGALATFRMFNFCGYSMVPGTANTVELLLSVSIFVWWPVESKRSIAVVVAGLLRQELSCFAMRQNNTTSNVSSSLGSSRCLKSRSSRGGAREYSDCLDVHGIQGFNQWNGAVYGIQGFASMPMCKSRFPHEGIIPKRQNR